MTSTASNRAWDADTLSGDPHARGDKARRVQSMFASIAGSYDLNNRLHAFGMDQRWRDVAVGMADLSPGDRVVDVACGTGDLAIKLAAALPPEARGGGPSVVGVDFTFPMLPLAARKGPAQGAPRYAAGDALRLPLPDRCCDAVTIAFGLRNVADPAAAVAEFARVLRPGGRLVVLEFVEPKNALIRLGNAIYTRGLMPLSATLLSGDRSGAYRYLPKSVATFLDTAGVADLYRAAGFERHQKPPPEPGHRRLPRRRAGGRLSEPQRSSDSIRSTSAGSISGRATAPGAASGEGSTTQVRAGSRVVIRPSPSSSPRSRRKAEPEAASGSTPSRR